jgi:hypothetical protein
MTEKTANDDAQPLAALQEALSAFEQGNYARAREMAESVKASGSAEDQSAAGELLARMSPAPLAKYLLLLTGVLLLVVTAFAYSH